MCDLSAFPWMAVNAETHSLWDPAKTLLNHSLIRAPKRKAGGRGTSQVRGEGRAPAPSPSHASPTATRNTGTRMWAGAAGFGELFPQVRPSQLSALLGHTMPQGTECPTHWKLAVGIGRERIPYGKREHACRSEFETGDWIAVAAAIERL